MRLSQPASLMVPSFVRVRELGRGEAAVCMNDLTDLAAEIFAGIFASDPDALVASIAVGDGAFTNVDGSPSSSIVAPVSSETEIRQLVTTAAVVRRSVTGNTCTYMAVLTPPQAAGEKINEFALLTRDGRMLAHAVDTGISTYAESREKSDIAYLLIEWVVPVMIA